MSIRLSKKTSIILIVILVLVIGGSAGYLIWRINQEDTVAPTDSEAGCVPVGTETCKEYEGGCDEARHLKGCGSGLPDPKPGFSWCQTYTLDCSSECGDNTCDSDESVSSCPEDCAKCGDDICSSTESLESCPDDCSVCGDDKCTGSEDSDSCPADCACKAMTWTNKPTGTYTKSSTLPTITVVSTNSTAETGVSAKLNGAALPLCPNSPNCYALTSDTSSQTLSVSLFSGLTQLEVGSYTLSATLPGASESCVESTSFVISEDAIVDVPDTGIFDGTLGKVYLGIGFVFMGVVTTQIPKLSYTINILGERNRIVMEKREKEKEMKKRDRFERRFK